MLFQVESWHLHQLMIHKTWKKRSSIGINHMIKVGCSIVVQYSQKKMLVT